MNRTDASVSIQAMIDTYKILKYHGVSTEIPMDDEDIEALSMALSALSADGEYIKKEDVELGLEKEYSHSLSEHDSHVFVEFMAFIDDLPTYSFPDREKEKENTNDN